MKSPEEIIREKTNYWKQDFAALNHHSAAGSRPKTGYLPIANTIAEAVDGFNRILDVGCGHGRLSLMLADHGHHVVASDVSEKMLQILDSLKGDLPVTTVCEDAHHLSAEDESFDAVISADFLVHFPDWRNILSEKARVCRSGGRIVFPFLFREHRNLARHLGVSTDEHPYSTTGESGKPYVAETSESELSAVSRRLGLRVVKIVPTSFFDWNHLLYGMKGVQEQRGFIKALNEKIEANDEVGQFYVWLMREAFSFLPFATTWYSVVVLEKVCHQPRKLIADGGLSPTIDRLRGLWGLFTSLFRFRR